MQVAILCGGLGTRLSEETVNRPKPMVEIGRRPILWHIMRFYRHFGHDRFVLCTGYKGDMIKDFFLDYRHQSHDLLIDLERSSVTELDGPDDRLDWKVIIQDTGIATQTASRLKKAMRYIEDDLFLATYGDGLCNVDLDRLVEHHRNSGKLATVTAVRPPARFGELVIKDDRVQRFTEKPQIGEGWINGGFFVLNRRVLDYIAEDQTPWEAEPLQALAREGELYAYHHPGFWQPMDTLREKQLLEDLWQSGRAPWMTTSPQERAK